MAKITTDLAALDSAATTVSKVSDILTHWGYTPGSYTTWGDARTDANQLLTGTALGAIANGEVGTTFVPKLNFLNDTAEVSKYGGAFVNGFRPEFGAFFDLDAYSVDNTPSTFSGAITHTRASTATYVDSNGVLKWAPHNLLRHSEEFDNAAWGAFSGAAPSETNILAPDGSNTADRFDYSALPANRYRYQNATLSGGQFTFSVWLKAPSPCVVGLRFGDFTGATGVTTTASVTTEWQLFTLTATISSSDTTGTIGFDQRNTVIAGVTENAVFDVWGAHLYRSDLGGMGEVPVADRVVGSTTYVPTTTAAVHRPRVGHHVWNGSAWVNEGLLHESEARTNLLAYSEAFDNVAWSGAVTHTADQIGPDGVTNSAYTLVDTSAASTEALIESLACADDTVARTLSVFFKKTSTATTFPGMSVIYSGGTAVNSGLTVNTNTGSVVARTGGVAAPVSFGIEDFGTYWRAHITVSNNGTGNTSVAAAISPAVNSDAGSAWVATTTGSCVAYGAQLEAAPTPSSYIPTSGSTVTRAADVLTIPSANLPWNPLAVSIQMDGRMTYADTNDSRQIQWLNWAINFNNSIFYYLDTTGATNPVVFRQISSGVSDQVNFLNVYSPGVLVPFNIASRHGSTFINGAVDGTALTADTTPVALPDLSATNLTLGQTYMGTIKTFRVWANDIGDAGISEASA